MLPLVESWSSRVTLVATFTFPAPFRLPWDTVMSSESARTSSPATTPMERLLASTTVSDWPTLATRFCTSMLTSALFATTSRSTLATI